MRRAVWLSVVLTALPTVAPGQSPASAAPSTSRDSAGVRIIESALAIWTPENAWRLAATPALVIGGLPDAQNREQRGEAYAFSRVAAAMRLSDGSVVVAERAAHELRYFDAAGRHVRTVGRKGQGPGEFTDIGTVMRLPGDTLAVESLRYTSIFAPDGQLVRQVRYGPFAPEQLQTPFVAVLGRFPNGMAIVGDFPQGRRLQGGAARWVDSSTLMLVDASGGVVRELGRIPAAAFAASLNAPAPLTLGPELVHASAAGHVYIGFGNEYAIREYDAEWQLRRIIRRAWTPREITPRDLDEYVDAWMARWSTETGAKRDRERLAQRNASYPDSLPAFSDFLASAEGELWLREPDLASAPSCMCLSGISDRPSSWSVFAADGRWLGDVQMPPRFTPTELGADYVLGHLREADDSLRVVMFEIVKPSAK